MKTTLLLFGLLNKDPCLYQPRIYLLTLTIFLGSMTTNYPLHTLPLLHPLRLLSRRGRYKINSLNQTKTALPWILLPPPLHAYTPPRLLFSKMIHIAIYLDHSKKPMLETNNPLLLLKTSNTVLGWTHLTRSMAEVNDALTPL